jgi:ketol-acid reductoisomerase
MSAMLNRWCPSSRHLRLYGRVPTSAFKVGDFESKVFEVEDLHLADRSEKVVKGGRHLLSKLPQAFKGVKQIGVIGYSSQGPAQALNLHESLQAAGVPAKVVVGLREGSKTAEQVKKDGLEVGEVYDVISKSDMVILLISDAAQTVEYKKVFAALKPGSFLGVSHGFLLGFLNNKGEGFPANVDVALVAPKGAGPSVRRLYVQGKTVNGAGINASFAIQNDATGTCVDKTLGWAIGIGSPYCFPTTMSAEYCSDIFGERGVLLGGAHGISEFLYRHFIRQGASKEEAYKRSAEAITGPISHTISKKGGMMGVYESLSASDKVLFEQAYSAAYHPLMETLNECYEEVRSGREIGSVIDKCDSFINTPTGEAFPMGFIGGTEMWKVGESVRKARTSSDPFARPVDPTAAGVYVACIVAQCDLLMANGHCYSEVANESIIEATDSLNPFMDHKGIDFMVDSCSYTARLGSRKWAPRFDYLLEQNAEPLLNKPADPARIKAFKENKIHAILAKCSEYRPSVDIAFTDS